MHCLLSWRSSGYLALCAHCRVSEVVTGLADPGANVIFGAVIDDAYDGEVWGMLWGRRSVLFCISVSMYGRRQARLIAERPWSGMLTG